MNLKNQIIFVVIAMFAMQACKKNSPNNSKPTSVDVYVVGINNVNDKLVATYWKNGVAIELPSNTPSVTNGIAIVGNDVYVVGGREISSSYYVAEYWKNGVPTDLADTTVASSALGIAVEGNDVYIVGSTTFAPNQAIATLWKNGIATTIGGNTVNSVATSIVIQQTGIYVCGTLSTPGRLDYTASYWKNGIETDLPLGNLQSAYAFSIAVNNNDVYIAGGGVLGSQGAAFYYKNGIATILSQSSSEAGAIAFQGNDMYVAGSITNGSAISTATVWKNGVPTSLTDVSVYSVANGMTIQGNDVYVAGEDVASNAAYWKNGVLVKLPQQGNNQSAAMGIVVIAH